MVLYSISGSSSKELVGLWICECNGGVFSELRRTTLTIIQGLYCSAVVSHRQSQQACSLQACKSVNSGFQAASELTGSKLWLIAMVIDRASEMGVYWSSLPRFL